MQSVESSTSGHKNDKTREWLYRYHYKSELAQMPELKRNEFIANWLIEIGFYAYGSMGITPISHTDIAAWRSNMGVKVEPEDVCLLLTLSKVYVSQYRSSSDRDAPPPSVNQIKDKAALGDRIKSGLRSLANPS